MSSTRREILDRLANGPTSGPQLAAELGVTRAAVWKHVDALREAGFEIQSTPNGYVLDAIGSYGKAALEFGLECPVDIEYHESIGSTNRRARKLASDGRVDIAVIANEQHAGRGRLDRSWIGPSGSIYCSLVVQPSLPPSEAPILTMAAAVSAVEAISQVGVQPVIKWPNDLLVIRDETEYKIGGILTEVAGEADRLRWAIIGIGINANVAVDSLPPNAISLQHLVGTSVDRREIVQALLCGLYDRLDRPQSILEDWRSHTNTLGRRVRVQTPTETIEGVATDVTFPGALCIDTGSDIVAVHAGDCEHLRPVNPD